MEPPGVRTSHDPNLLYALRARAREAGCRPAHAAEGLVEQRREAASLRTVLARGRRVHQARAETLMEAVTCVDRTIRGLCWWKECRRLLPKYKRHYCSNRCATLFAMNHNWNTARAWAIKLAHGMCEHCKRFVAEYQDWYPSADDDRCPISLVLEVNHIAPLNGSARTKTCANHQMNLECLCHDCHVGVTTTQR